MGIDEIPIDVADWRVKKSHKNKGKSKFDSPVSGYAKGHYDDVIMGAIASQITSLTIVYSTVYSDADQRKHQSSASLAFVWGIHRGPVSSPHTWPVTRKMLPFYDVIMRWNSEQLMLTYCMQITFTITRNNNAINNRRSCRFPCPPATVILQIRSRTLGCIVQLFNCLVNVQQNCRLGDAFWLPTL